MKTGIIGTGRIAKRFVTEAAVSEDMEVTAVYNPHEGSAEKFLVKTGLAGSAEKYPAKTGLAGSAEKYPAKTGLSGNAEKHNGETGIGNAKAYTELSPFFANVEAVYIASPHETHAGYIREALFAGKHVLCEKPMALNGDEALELFTMARERRLVLMEGIKTAYCPGFQKLQELIVRGDIGEIRYVEACFTKLEDPSHRELVDERYGGSFLELGSYVMFPVLRIFGTDIRKLAIETLKAKNGLDIFAKASIHYDEWMATATCGLGVKADGRLMISGTKGYILVTPPWWKTTHIEVHYEDPMCVDTYNVPYEGDGLQYELKEFMKRINNGTVKSVSLPDGMECGVKEEESVTLAAIMKLFLDQQGRRESGYNP